MSTKKIIDSIRLAVDPKSQHADLYLIGRIGADWFSGGGNTAQRVLAELSGNTEIKNITVHLASMGGNFLDGLPIFNLLKQHPANVTVNIIGYALSMGSVIMLAGDKIVAAQNSIIMIHNAQGNTAGSPSDMRKMADILATHERAIIPSYMARLGKTAPEVQALLDAETWYTAAESLAAGLIDEISDPVDLGKIDKQQPDNAWSFAATNFKHPVPEFIERLENHAQQNRPWVEKILNRMVGILPAPITPETDTDEDDMTAEELKAVVAEIATSMAKDQKIQMEKMIDDKLAALAKSPSAEAPDVDNSLDAELSAKLAAMQQENASLKAQVAELSTPAPGTTVIPESTGAAGEWDYGF